MDENRMGLRPIVVRSRIDTLPVMKSASTSLLVHPAFQTPQIRTLRVAALYDSLPAEVRVHAVIEALARRHGSQVRIECRAWNFDMLTRLDLRHASARAASGSHMMIVAAQATEMLPEHVKSWMTICMRQHSSRLPVLVAADAEISRRPGNPSALNHELMSIASMWRTRLRFSREFAKRTGHLWMMSPDNVESHNGLQSAVNDSFYAGCRTRGGINE